MNQIRQTLGRLLCAVLVMFSMNVSAQLKVNGRYLYDQCNEKIVLRGVNEMFIYSSDREGVTTYPQIAMTGANAVRFMWRTDATVPLSAFENNIKNCVANKMIPIPGLWDATGKWGADFEKCVSWWLNPEVVAICQRNPYLILNIANEAGGSTMADYTSVYSNAIQRLRNAGITNVIMVDADRWGRNWTTIRDKGAAVLAADPQKNVMFAWHPWDTNMDYATPINTIVAQNLCFVVGEFSYKSVGCTCCIDYKQIMATAQTQQVGTLAWSWGLVKNGDCTDGSMDMTTNATFAGLKSGWPTEIATTDPNSIKNTSVRPYSIRNNGTCAVTTVPVSGVTVSPTSRSIAVNGTVTLVATVSPSNATNKAVTWSSSNTNVATVSNTGLVTGKAVGTATITVTTQDGGKTATSAITVTSSSRTSTIIASADTDTQSDANGTNTRVNPSQYNRAFFRFSLSGVGTVSSAKLRIYKASTATGTLSVYNANDNWVEGPTNPTKPTLGTLITSATMGSTASYIEIDVTSRVSQETTADDLVTFGVTTNLSSWTPFHTRENTSNKPQLVVTHTGGTLNSTANTTLALEEEATTLSVSPNPASDYVNVNFAVEKSQNVKYQILNLMSQQVLAGEKLVSAGSNSLSINVSSLQQGVYLLRIEKDGKSSVTKLMVE